MSYSPLNPNGQATMANSQPVVLASDQSGVPITSATLATAAKQDSLLAELQLKADLTETQPVSLATVPSHAVTNAGTFAVQESGAALTSLQLIDDTIFVDDTATHSTGSTKGIGIMAAATPTDTAVNANDIGMVGMTNNREMYVSLRDINGTAAVNGSGTATGALRVEIANNGTGLVGLNAGTNAIGKLAANSGVDIGDVDVTSIAAGDNNIGNVDIVTMPGTGVEDAAETAGGILLMAGTVRRDTQASSAGTTGDNATLNTDATGGLWIAGNAVEDAAETAGGTLVMIGAVRRDTPASSSGTTGDNSTVNTDANGAIWVSLATKLDATNDAVAPGVRTTGGADGFRSLDLDETEEEVKASAGTLYGYYFFNAAASARYLKLYNATAANVTVGSTTPLYTFPLPAGQAGHVWFGSGVAFSTAITAAATTGLADADTGAPSANDVIINIFYK